MKQTYNLGNDLFIIIAFVTFISGGFLKLLGIQKVWEGVSSNGMIIIAVICLLFSISLSLNDVSHGK